MRALVGFLIAPLPTALFQSLIVALHPKDGLGIYQHPLSMFVAIALYFYSLGMLVGVPILLFTRKRGNHTLGRYAWATALIMLLPVTVAMVAWTLKGHPSLYAVAYIMALFGFGGAFAGSLFWWIARRNRQVEATTKIFG